MTRHGELASGLTQLGKVGIELTCGCGHVTAAELSLIETRDFIALLQANLALAARVRALPLPFVHKEGAA
jgi:hypothetical protein